MASQRRIVWARIAIGAVLTIGALSIASAPASAQGPGRGRVAEPYTPAKDAKDLKAVLFNWMRNEGMLKGHDERDMVAMLEYQGKGTIQVEGQPCILTKYRASTPWVLPTRVLQRNANPNAGLLTERGNCEVYETKDISSQIRH